MSSTEHGSQTARRVISIRPIRLTDTDMETEFVRRLSLKTTNFRFFGAFTELTPEMLRSFRDVDYRHSMAFVATVSQNGTETEIGVSRYAPNANEDIREMAVSVANDWQHQGIGAMLTEKLIEFSRDHGVKQLYAVDVADNAAMQQLADAIGMRARRDPDDTNLVIYSLSL